MRSKLFLIIVLATMLLPVMANYGVAAKKVPAKVDREQVTVVRPSQSQTTEEQTSTGIAVPVTQTPAASNSVYSPQAGEEINWQVLASGGGMQTLGTLVLGSTIGQSAAGTSSLGTLTLQSGFWQNFEQDYLCGDIDGSGAINISDVVYLIAYIFTAGPAPQPPAAADVDCDGMISIADAVYMVEYIFTHGEAPCASCP